MKSFLNNPNMPRGLRNNNVGNIRKSNQKWIGKINGTDGSFEQFVSVPHGIRAVFKILQSYHKQGHNTIQKMINRYAPNIENNTQAYIDTVAQRTKIAPNKVVALNKDNLIELAKAIVLIENFGGAGKQYAHLVNEQDYEDAYRLLTGEEKKK